MDIKLNKIVENKGQIEGLPKNPRFIRDDKFELLKKSLQDDPEMLELRELIVYPLDGKFVAICGNMRYRAAKDLGFKEIPCKVLSPDTPAEKLRAIATKDNVSFGSWDMEMLSLEWITEEMQGWGVDLFSSTSELDVESFFTEEDNPEKAAKTATCPHCGKEHEL